MQVLEVALLARVNQMDRASLEKAQGYRAANARIAVRRLPEAALSLLMAMAFATLAGCAVGPDFATPPVPEVARYTDTPLPEKTGGPTPRAGIRSVSWTGATSRPNGGRCFVPPPQPADRAGHRGERQPGGRAGDAATGAGKPRPPRPGTCCRISISRRHRERQQFSPAEFGGTGPPFIFNLFNPTVNVSYLIDVWGGQRRALEASQAQADYQRFQLEATFLTLTANVVHDRDPGSVAARPDQGHAGHHQERDRSARGVARAIQSRRRREIRRAGAGGRTRRHPGDLAAAGKTARAAAQPAGDSDGPVARARPTARPSRSRC